MALLKIYIIGVIAGLIFPVVDDLLYCYSQTYRGVGSVESNDYVKVYRMGPFLYKLAAAFIPVMNLLWVITLLLIIRLYLVSWSIDLKIAIIKRLAKNPKKAFITRHWIVKHIFPRYLTFFHRRVEMHFLESGDNLESIKQLLDILDKVSKMNDEEIDKIVNDEQQTEN